MMQGASAVGSTMRRLPPIRCGRGEVRTSSAAIRWLLPALQIALAAPVVAAGPSTGLKIEEYRINAGDELEVFVWGEERLQRPLRVLPDGSFSFPLAGTIAAEGHTSREVAEIIRERIRDKYRNGPPDVTVTVRDPAGMRFFVLGKVRSPGSYPIGRSVNVAQALSLAGGPAEFADIGNAVILRQTPAGQTVERVSLGDVLKGGRALKTGPQEPLPTLRIGDVLVVP